ncbi:unnamed protein product [Ixodes pacificus]
MDVNKALCLGTPRNLRPLYFFPRRHYVGGLRVHALREAVGEGRPVFPNLARGRAREPSDSSARGRFVCPVS